jgi:hypothetical protein
VLFSTPGTSARIWSGVFPTCLEGCTYSRRRYSILSPIGLQSIFKEVIQSHDYDGKAKLREAAVAFMERFQLHFSKVSPIVGNSLLQVAFPWEPRNPAGFDVS